MFAKKFRIWIPIADGKHILPSNRGWPRGESLPWQLSVWPTTRQHLEAHSCVCGRRHGIFLPLLKTSAVQNASSGFHGPSLRLHHKPGPPHPTSRRDRKGCSTKVCFKMLQSGDLWFFSGGSLNHGMWSEALASPLSWWVRHRV